MSSSTTSKLSFRDKSFLDSLDTIEIESSSDDDLMLKEQVPDKSSRKRFTKKEQSKRSIHSEMVTFPLQGFISRLIHCLTISFREE